MSGNSTNPAETLKKLYVAHKQLQARLGELEQARKEPIAVIGMACRYPAGTDTPEKLWEFLRGGQDAMTDVPADRWPVGDYFDPDPEAPGKMYSLRGGFLLEDVYGFDPAFFGLTPKEVLGMDPQHRLLLEVSWEALENAGLEARALKGSQTGVFVGISGYDYAMAHVHSGDPAKLDAYSVTGIAMSTAPNRVSYLLGLEGPSLAVDTACSSSLVAVHLACQSLRSGESRLALAGGVNLTLAPEINVGFSRMKGLSPTGACKVFDAAADGYTRGEGCGLLVLQRYSEAIKDGHPVLALVLGSAVNQDGRSNGFTAPNGRAQKNVIREALRNAGLSPDAVGYVEAHGTGTPLGDPIEMEALAGVYGQGRKAGTLRVGSVKANLGHLEAAAGSAGLIKAILQLRHRTICPQLHFQQPTPHVPWSDIPIEIPTRLTDWPGAGAGEAAGVSGFGFGGTNAHVILQQAPPVPAAAVIAPPARPFLLLPLSARSPAALRTMSGQYIQLLEPPSGSADVPVAEICAAAAVTRSGFAHRLAVVGKSAAELAATLRGWLAGGAPPGCWQSDSEGKPPTRVAFLFSGQGSQYRGMGRELWESQPHFQAALRECAEILQPELEIGLLDLLYGEGTPESVLHQTVYTQPVIFSFGYALAKMWEAWGLSPAVVLGHSIGEMAAACFAGVIDLPDALRLVALRGRLIQRATAPGMMGAIVATLEKVQAAIAELGGQVGIAAVNAPENVVISGETTAVERVLEHFRMRDMPTRPLRVSHAIHSPLMEPILEEYYRAAAKLRFSPPKIPLISNLSGRLAGAEITQTDYWCRQLRETVRFQECMETLREVGCRAAIETGGTSTLTSLGTQCLPGADILWLPTLGANNLLFNMRPRRAPGQSDWETLLGTLGQLHARNVDLNWKEIERDRDIRRARLPNYPFQRKQYRMELTRHSSRKAQNNGHVPQESTPEPKPAPAPGRGLEFATSVAPSCPPNDPARALSSIQAKLKLLLVRISGLEPEGVDLAARLLEMGIDSLMVSRFREAIRQEFQVLLDISWFFNRTDTLTKIAEYIAAQAPVTVAGAVSPNGSAPEVSSPDSRMAGRAASDGNLFPAPVATSETTTGATELERIFQQQLQTMSRLMGAQLEVLRAGRTEAAIPAAPVPPRAPEASAPRKLMNVRSVKFEADPLTERQSEFVRQLVAFYNRRTSKSKDYAATHRKRFADWINTLGFRQTLKEMMYPVVSDRSQGARIWDLDGNEYLDLAIGYGVTFFGHGFPPVMRAVQAQLERGYDLGPQSALAAEVAALVCQLTGVERVAFSNTGSESVMIALRLARTVTGKNKVVMFNGSYHGISDGVLAAPSEDGRTMPSAPGIPQSLVDNVVLLDYGTPDTLEAIRQLAPELAAVLVEPVQSRRPGFHPKAFLHQLRELTETAGVALIWDEMITGFRIHPGGAQAWFGVQADLVTYGKIAGGGLPLGIVAGKARFMDAVDGGPWQYGDQSHPEKEMTFFAGTFCKHPLSMAAAKAVLTHIRDGGDAAYELLRGRAAWFVGRLNDFFRAERVPIKVEHFGPLFRMESFGKYHLLRQPLEMDLLFYLLLSKGVYTWERRICCLSMALTEADLEEIIQKIQASIRELRAGGFAFESEPPPSGGATAPGLCPAASPQRRIYVLDQIDGEKSSYQMFACQTIEGGLDPVMLEQAFQKLLNRHESLRTRFETPDGVLTQVIEPVVDFRLEVLEADEQSLPTVLTSFAERFDLGKAPLFRARLVRLSPRKHLLAMSSHHIVIDGLSWNIFVQELLQLCQGRTLPPLRRQYRDYCDWLARYPASPEFPRQETYWRDTFAGDVPVLNLPTDWPRPAVRTADGDTVQLLIPRPTTEALKSLGRSTGTTLYMILLAAYNLLLHRLTRTWDVVVGSPTSGRPPEGYDEVVGMFANTLPIRLRADPAMTTRQFLASVKTRLSEIYDFQNYPFERLVEKLDLKRDPSRNALFDTLLVFERGDDRVIELPGLRFTPYPWTKTTAIFDLSLEIVEQQGELRVAMEFSTGLFKRETVARWGRYFERILTLLPGALDAAISRLPLLDEKETAVLLETCNRGVRFQVPAGRTVLQEIEERVQRHGDRLAVEGSGESLTYAELAAQSDHLAAHLRSLGVGGQSRVVVACERSGAAIVGILGILKAGGAYVPLDPGYPAERFAFVLADIEPTLVLTQAKLQPLFGGFRGPLVLLDEWRPSATQVPALPEVGSTQLAYCIYTSGSTGKPKGVLVNHANLAHAILARSELFREPVERFLLLPSFAFDASVVGIFWTLATGGTLVLPAEGGQADVAHLSGLVRAHRVTHWLSVPSLYELLLAETPAAALASLRVVIVAGDICPKVLVERHNQVLPGGQFYNEYGPTEGTVWCAAARVQSPDLIGYATVPIGRPLPGGAIHLLDEQLQLVPPGVPGELCLGGPGVAQGYWRRPELSAAKFIADPFATSPGARLYRTGDLAVYRADGNLEFCGRADRQIKLHGYRIELDEVEAVLAECPAVREGVVSLHSRDGQADALVAHVVGRGPTQSEERLAEEVLHFLRNRLPGYMVPAAVVALARLPLNANGKTDRNALPPPAAPSEGQSGVIEAPRNDTERHLVEVWESVLGHSPIGIHQRYLDLGGDSIRAIQIAARLRQRRLVLRIPDLFRYPTIAQLAMQLRTTQRAIAQHPVTGSVALTPVQQWFWELNLGRTSHYNQAVMLKTARTLELSPVSAALQALVRHHDLLRAHLVVSSGISLSIPATVSPVSVDFVDLRGAPTALDQLEQHAREVQARVNLERSPLLAAAIYRLEDGDRLLIAIHHLVVDLLSWRILVEDLGIAYRQFQARLPLELPPKTDSFQRWSEHLREEVSTAHFRSQKSEWEAMLAPWSPPFQLPVLADDIESRQAEAGMRMELTLEAAATSALLEANRSYRTELRELLLAAVVRLLAAWAGSPGCHVDLENHGRTPVAGADLDLGRTVGWFTSLFPVRLAAVGDWGLQIKTVKEALRRVPDSGIGFGVLRYLQASVGGGAPSQRGASVVFNFLGELAPPEANDLFVKVEEFTPGALAPDAVRPHDLEIEAWIREQKLGLAITFSRRQFTAEQIQHQLAALLGLLSGLTEHCLGREKADLTPADFTHKGMTLEDVQDLLADA